MHSQARKTLKRLGYNKRPWAFEDVEQCCYELGVEIVYLDAPKPGCYGVCEGVPCVVLRPDLRGIKKLEVGCHELGHHLYHSPKAALYAPSSHSKREFEAQRFAICAMIPEPLLRRFVSQNTLWDLQEEYGYGSELFEFRLRVMSQCRNWPDF